ncbi:hypothetical protein BSKO_04242 [Bryopsis sp. KO-2023]|nr:hypothetical protein BSKO_04242 [Bryopsis sp. KO-2023]
MGGLRKSSKAKTRKAKSKTVKNLSKQGAPGDPFAYLVPPEQLKPVECVSSAGKREKSFNPLHQNGKPVQSRISVASILNDKKTEAPGKERKVITTNIPSPQKKNRSDLKVFESFPIGDVGLCPQGPRKSRRRPASAPVKKHHNVEHPKVNPIPAVEVRRRTLSRPAGSSSFLATGAKAIALQAKRSPQNNPELGPGSYNIDSTPNTKAIASNTAMKQIKSDYTARVQAATDAEKPPNKESPSPTPAQAVLADARPQSASPGTSSFKASPRPVFRPKSAAAHLSSHQYQPKLSATQNRILHLVSKFNQDSSPRNSPRAVSKMSPFLGPGSHFKKPPTSYMGKHLQAGHKGESKVLDIAKYTARPGSAPPNLKLQAEQVVQPWLDKVEEGEEIEDFVYEDDGSGSDMDPAFNEDDLPLEHPLESRDIPKSLAAFAPDWDTPRYTKRAPSPRAKPHPLGPGSYLGQDSGFSSTGFKSKPKGGTISKCGRNTVPMTAQNSEQDITALDYDPKDHVQGHRTRAPSWDMPQNTVEKSKMWLFSGSGTLS